MHTATEKESNPLNSEVLKFSPEHFSTKKTLQKYWRMELILVIV